MVLQHTPETKKVIDSIFNGEYYGDIIGNGYTYEDVANALESNQLNGLNAGQVQEELVDTVWMMEEHFKDGIEESVTIFKIVQTHIKSLSDRWNEQFGVC